uniref:Gonadotropin-releasing hormone short-isoform n=1 Tax=Macrobrachium rosenbergii TaxID=79674 RepID=A0A1B1R4E0_MACRS|nr:gonadotropin-releasing hormone short-isoform precursor [Macrobrachium rosenbergii]
MASKMIAAFLLLGLCIATLGQQHFRTSHFRPDNVGRRPGAIREDLKPVGPGGIQQDLKPVGPGGIQQDLKPVGASR